MKNASSRAKSLKRETTLAHTCFRAILFSVFFPRFEHISAQVAKLNVDVARRYNSVATHCFWHQVKLNLNVNFCKSSSRSLWLKNYLSIPPNTGIIKAKQQII